MTILKPRFFLVLLLVCTVIFGFAGNGYAVDPDTTAPFSIANLSISATDTSSETLSWRAPGDDGGSQQPEYVIVISVDGMGSYYVQPLLSEGSNEMVSFERFINEGAGTLNARDDPDYAITLPNHVTMMTSRGVDGESGHNWSSNSTPDPADTIAANKGSYVASAFDVAHDNGLRTGIWAGKTKFNLFQQSYSSASGANDVTGVDNGKDKIDYDNITNGISAADLTPDFLSQMGSDPFNFSFVHFQDPDATGHSSGWSTDPSSDFAVTLKAVDTQIGNILDAIESSSTLNGKTTVILTADHGGHGTTHGDTTNNLDYTIPFYVWGADVSVGDLYTLNASTRTAPGESSNPDYTGSQPVRDGDAGNLALSLLGLSSIPNSTIDSSQDLATQNFGTAASYDIRYSTSTITGGNWDSATQAASEPSPEIAGTTQTFTVSGLNSGATYYFAMETSDEVPNESALSNVASGTTVLAPPTAPSSCSATKDSDSQFTITWDDSSYNEDGFKVERNDDGEDFIEIGTSAATTYTDSTTSANHSYQYRVLAYNDAGNSIYSTDAETYYTTPSAPTIEAPTVDSSTAITWNWQDNSSYEESFILTFVEGSETDVNDIVADAISYQSTGLSPNTKYSVNAKSYRSDTGESAASDDSDEVYTEANTPNSLILTVQSTSQVSASWGTNSNPEGTYYYIENTTNSTNSDWINTASWTSSGLSCNGLYSFSVKARNGDAIETESVTSQARTSNCGGGGGGGYTPSSIPTTQTNTTQENINELTIEDTAGLILQLQVRIAELKAQLAELLGEVPQAVYPFKRNLYFGSVGEDVKELQRYLNNNGFEVALSSSGSKGNETIFFGRLTEIALIKFQKQNNINPSAGFFGPITRNFIFSE